MKKMTEPLKFSSGSVFGEVITTSSGAVPHLGGVRWQKSQVPVSSCEPWEPELPSGTWIMEEL
jgi:hypothetical protein